MYLVPLLSIFEFSLGVCSMELHSIVSFLEYLVSNGRQVLLEGIRFGGSTTTAISEFLPTWIQKLQDGYFEDPDDKQLLTELTLTGSNPKGYTLQDGVIRFKGRVWIGNNSLAQ